MKTFLAAILAFGLVAFSLPVASASPVICGGSALNCVQAVEDYALHCGLLPAYDVATCWVADSGVWYDFVVNGVVVGLVGCGVIGGPACLQPICQPFHEAWPHYCPPN